MLREIESANYFQLRLSWTNVMFLEVSLYFGELQSFFWLVKTFSGEFVIFGELRTESIELAHWIIELGSFTELGTSPYHLSSKVLCCLILRPNYIRFGTTYRVRIHRFIEFDISYRVWKSFFIEYDSQE